jgi:hypothetical protein
MASFKRLKRSDVISVPYVANKNWVFEYCPYPENDQYIKIYKGTNLSGSFSTKYDPVTEGQYERLIYSQINHLFYQNYSSSNQNLDTSSLMSSLYYDGASQNRSTGSYFNYNDNPGLVKNFPTGAMGGIRILSINQDLYGQQVLPYAFELSSSVYYVKDDGIGNLIDYKNSNTHIGNIFYSHGIAVVTNQDYQSMWPLPPLANYKEVNYLDTDTSRVIPISASVTLRNTNDVLLTGSLELFNFDYTLFTDNNNGNTTFANVGLGDYYTNYTFDTTLSGSNCADSTLTSNPGLIKVIVKNNCEFDVSVAETTVAPTPSPVTPSPVTPEPTSTPVTPTPATPQPVTPQPVTPEPTSTPVTPQPVTPQPATPQPVTPTPITPAPTPIYYEFPITTGYGSSNSACGDSFTNMSIYGSSPSFLSNATFYSDYTLLSPYDGSNFYYKNTSNNEYVQISSIGSQTAAGTCP